MSSDTTSQDIHIEYLRAEQQLMRGEIKALDARISSNMTEEEVAKGQIELKLQKVLLLAQASVVLSMANLAMTPLAPLLQKLAQVLGF